MISVYIYISLTFTHNYCSHFAVSRQALVTLIECFVILIIVKQSDWPKYAELLVWLASWVRTMVIIIPDLHILPNVYQFQLFIIFEKYRLDIF